ncbi:MAG: response regulator transcription factor [Gammaproteobacteria bacterium]|nr:response regulator transcription factor [Gammaproteobacteria bacterium]MDH5593627.1 response regulator transcription factor [Gammaproteobacteria bacterium]
MNIALLEDDIHVGELIQLWLKEAGHDCTHYTEGEKFISEAHDQAFDMVILDWMLPDINGDKVLEWIRSNIKWSIPVLFVTMRDSERDIVYALEHGADDYMTKPVKQMEMLARINALSRRSDLHPVGHNKIEIGSYSIDITSRNVTHNDKPVQLTQKEFELIAFLFKNINTVMSRKYILESVWGRSGELNTRTVDTHISRIRNKLELGKEKDWRLSAIYHHGYRLEFLGEELKQVEKNPSLL